MQPQTTPASPPLVPPTMIGGEIPLIDVSGHLWRARPGGQP